MTTTERTGVPIAPYAGMPSTGTRGRKHEPDSLMAALSRERVRILAQIPEERAKASENDAAVTR